MPHQRAALSEPRWYLEFFWHRAQSNKSFSSALSKVHTMSECMQLDAVRERWLDMTSARVSFCGCSLKLVFSLIAHSSARGRDAVRMSHIVAGKGDAKASTVAIESTILALAATEKKSESQDARAS